MYHSRGEGYACVGMAVYRKFLYFLRSFAVNLNKVMLFTSCRLKAKVCAIRPFTVYSCYPSCYFSALILAFSYLSSTLLPQGLFTGCFLCLECSFSRYPLANSLIALKSLFSAAYRPSVLNSNMSPSTHTLSFSISVFVFLKYLYPSNIR